MITLFALLGVLILAFCGCLVMNCAWESFKYYRLSREFGDLFDGLGYMLGGLFLLAMIPLMYFG